MTDVAMHVMTRTLKEVFITPDHAQRTESAEFRKTKERLKADGHYKCWVCGRIRDVATGH